MTTKFDLVEGLASASADTETNIGTITLSSNARVITRIHIAVNDVTKASGAPLSGYVRLDSPDFPISPCKLPFMPVADVVTSGGTPSGIVTYECNIPCSGNGRVYVYATLTQAVTTAPEVQVCLQYEA